MTQEKLFQKTLEMLRGWEDRVYDHELINELKKILLIKDQERIDDLSTKILEEDPNLQEPLELLLGQLTCERDDILSENKEQLLGSMFLIPIVIGIDPDTKEDPDDLLFMKFSEPGTIAKLFIKNGLISEDADNIGLMSRLYTAEEVSSFTETQRMSIMQRFYPPFTKLDFLLTKTRPLKKGSINIVLRYLLGVSTIKEPIEASPLGRLLYPHAGIQADQMNQDLKRLDQLKEDLASLLPKTMNQNVRFATPQGLYFFSRVAIMAGLMSLDRFHLSLLLEKTKTMPQSTITLAQTGDKFKVSLKESPDSKEESSVILGFLTMTDDELKIYLESIISEIENAQFISESKENNEVLVFSKVDYGQERSSPPTYH